MLTEEEREETRARFREVLESAPGRARTLCAAMEPLGEELEFLYVRHKASLRQLSRYVMQELGFLPSPRLVQYVLYRRGVKLRRAKRLPEPEPYQPQPVGVKSSEGH